MKVEGTLSMSQKEQDRLRILWMVKGCTVTLVKAAELLGLSYRHRKRVYKRYRDEGDKGLIHRSRGRPSNRRKDPAVQNAVLERYRTRYEGFGPTLANEKLGIDIIPANSPQAKGRVERKNGVYQDRLVKELRLEGVNTIDGGNRVLAGGFLDDLNKRFAVEPRNSTDLHRPIPEGLDLRQVFCFEEERMISNDWTVRYQGRVFQIKKGTKVLPPARKKVLVQEWLDGSIHLFYREQEVEHSEITENLTMRPATVTDHLWIPRMTSPQLAASPQ